MGDGYRTFSAGDILTAAQVQGYLQDQAVMVFADASARDAAVTGPTEGMVVYLTSTNFIQIYDGAAWNDVIDSGGSPAGGTMPIGALLPYAGTTAPSAAYLLCDGQAVSRTTYSDLFAVVSTTFGIGDGTTTFNVPDLRGRIAMGLDNLGGTPANRVTDANADALGGTVGAQDHTLTEAELPSHSHSQTAHTHSVDPPSTSVSFNQTIRRVGNYALGGATTADAYGPYSGTTLTGTVNVSSFTSGSGGGGSTGGTGSGNAHSILQPSMAIGYLIRAT
jgi:microcystin-dependent protein